MAHITFYRADDYSRIGLERIYAYFDHLHDIASEGHVREVTAMTPAELVEYLHEVCYTLDETILEIEAHEARLTSLTDTIVNDMPTKEGIER